MYFRHIEDAAALAVGRSPAELSRRQFLKLTTLAGSGLTLGMVLPGCGTGPGGSAAGPLVMPFVRIAPDNTVTVISKHLEAGQGVWTGLPAIDRKSTRLNSSHSQISYAVFCLKKKKTQIYSCNYHTTPSLSHRPRQSQRLQCL